MSNRFQSDENKSHTTLMVSQSRCNRWDKIISLMFKFCVSTHSCICNRFLRREQCLSLMKTIHHHNPMLKRL